MEAGFSFEDNSTDLADFNTQCLERHGSCARVTEEQPLITPCAGWERCQVPVSAETHPLVRFTEEPAVIESRIAEARQVTANIIQ